MRTPIHYCFYRPYRISIILVFESQEIIEPPYPLAEERRERDSNPRSGNRIAVFKTAALNHSAIPPRVL